VRTRDDFACRQKQIAALIQGYEAGFLPGKPDIVNATFTSKGTSGTLSITAGFSNTTISFSSTITYPSTTVPEGGWPLLIGLDGGSIPVPSTVSGSRPRYPVASHDFGIGRDTVLQRR
jgi:hypothetical protein